MSDLIDRQAAIDAITDKNITCNMDSVQDSELHRVKRAVHRILTSLPSAKPKRGEWTKENACEFCGYKPWYERDIHTLNFCPNCGADMRGEGNG